MECLHDVSSSAKKSCCVMMLCWYWYHFWRSEGSLKTSQNQEKYHVAAYTLLIYFSLMPSKKKNRGKARRNVAKDCGDDVAAIAEQKPPLHSQMKGLNIDKAKDAQADDEDALLKEAIKLAAAEKRELEARDEAKEKEAERLIEARENCCKHGYNPSPSEFGFCKKIMDVFKGQSVRSTTNRGGSILECLMEGDKEVTKNTQKPGKILPG